MRDYSPPPKVSFLPLHCTSTCSGITFSNLTDGSNLTAGVNKFHASHSGGDGNDLTFDNRAVSTARFPSCSRGSYAPLTLDDLRQAKES